MAKQEEHDSHIRHHEDRSGSHLSNAMKHLDKHREAEHYDVEQHADRMGDEHDRAGGGRDDADPRGVREAAEGTMERGAGIKEAKGVAGRAKIWDEGDKDQPKAHSRVDKPGV